MRIIKPPEFFSTVKDCHLILDTNVFVDAYSNPREFKVLFDELKKNGVVLITLDLVLFEFLKGASEDQKFQVKKEFLETIVDAYQPVTKYTSDIGIDLIKEYRERGKGVEPVDFLLGAALKQYRRVAYLMTKNTNHFPSAVFDLKSYLLMEKAQSLQAYGIYSYTPK